MRLLPTLTLASDAAYQALSDHLTGRLAALADDGLADSNTADDVEDALDHLRARPTGYPHTITLTSSNALRALAAGREDLIADRILGPADITLSDET